MARIRRIVVEKLFGVFDHDIRLNEGGITLIHGPNGYGKTAILTLVDELAKGRRLDQHRWPHEAFFIELDDGTEFSALSPVPGPVRELKTRLIRTQRLNRDDERDPVVDPAHRQQVIDYVGRSLAWRYGMAQAHYAEVSQRLERSFPRRVIDLEAESQTSSDALRDELIALEDRRRQLNELGLIAEEGDEFALPQREASDAAHQVLHVYVEDTRKKLAVFDEVSRKAALFKEIINRRFTYKSCRLSQEGLHFVAPDGHEIPPGNLSSGEQHEVVLLYELLFETAPGTLVMIDEPELSLHVAWQIEWLRDLEHIVELTGIDVLVATHSPQIINDRWDLTVELKGPEA